jgi:hypothetical protein
MHYPHQLVDLGLTLDNPALEHGDARDVTRVSASQYLGKAQTDSVEKSRLTIGGARVCRDGPIA